VSRTWYSGDGACHPLILLAVLASGCLQPARYRLPLAGNPQREATQACYEGCRAQPGDGRYSCLERCPGAVVTSSASCAREDRPPAALCEDRRVADPARTTILVVVVAGVATLLLFAAVDASLDDSVGDDLDF
jgi:hypothetical protein